MHPYPHLEPHVPHFDRDLFQFLKELNSNNNRDWFQANKSRYESVVKDPLRMFVAAASERLKKLSKEFEAGAVFRINRDTRFSKDKSPYKTNAAAHFPHRKAGAVHTPGFYLHLEPGNSMGGGGLWMPEPPLLAKVRNRIVSKTAEWKAVVKSDIAIEGESLKRPPQGYDADHPFVNDLKRKSFIALTSFSDRDVCSASFLDRYIETCRDAASLVRFLTRAAGLPW